MGTSDKDSAREDVASWLKQHETKFFLAKLEEEIGYSFKVIGDFNTSGETLSRDYYRQQGAIFGLRRAIELAELLTKGEE